MPVVTLADLRTRVLAGLDSNTALYPTRNIDLVINQGLRRINLLVGLTQVTVPVPGFSRAAQQVYSTPSPILIPLQVYNEGKRMEKVTMPQLAQAYRRWFRDSGPPRRWAPIGITQWVSHPADSTGGRFLEMAGVSTIAPLTQSDSVISMPDQFVDLLVDYARSRVMLKLPGAPFAGASLAYQAMIRALKSLSIWSGMKWPQYWLLKQTDPGGAKGV